ncbi:hypothetical protein BC628DRAFT_1097262 [Trametes gibbosa]|nr:hypothetical protein BC628DRAFT_1097262 [Trametes gibbosa]
MPHPSVPRPLPTELLEMILVQAWLEIPVSDTRARWRFFQTGSLVDSRWRDVVHRVARKHVIVCLHSKSDLRGYRAIARRLLDSKSASARTGAERTTTDSILHDTHLRASIFRNSSIFIHFPHADTLSLQADKLASNPKAMDYLCEFNAIVPDCMRLSITMLDGFSLESDPTMSALKFAARLPSLTDLDFASPFHVSHIPQLGTPPPISPQTQLPNVRYLRLASYPACTCIKSQTACTTHGHGQCSAELFVASFSGVEHLHIGNPYHLKNILCPPTLHTLTLEIPRARTNRQCSMLGYKLIEALTRGWLCGPTSDTPPRRIVVLSPEEPLGWGPAKAACEERGITLSRSP